MTDDWRTDPQTAAAADKIRRWIDERTRELLEYEIDAVRQHLQTESWEWDLDLSGVPWETVDRLKWAFTDAWNALTAPYRVEEALADLRRARELVTPDAAHGQK